LIGIGIRDCGSAFTKYIVLILFWPGEFFESVIFSDGQKRLEIELKA
jgi:hypothetical protein